MSYYDRWNDRNREAERKGREHGERGYGYDWDLKTEYWSERGEAYRAGVREGERERERREERLHEEERRERQLREEARRRREEEESEIQCQQEDCPQEQQADEREIEGEAVP